MICVPSGILLLGSLLMTDSPNSLVTRGKRDAARKSLRRLRGVDDVDAELEDLVRAAASAGVVNTRAAWRLLASERKYWPSVIVAFMGVTFNWWSGNAAATFCLCLLDRFKRRTLLFWSAALQASAQAVAAALFAVYLVDAPDAVVPAGAGKGILGMIIIYELAFMAGQNTTVTAIMGAAAAAAL
ncbi:hypothetical protein MNEG_14785 [Monoraphidium neglectum]|uniref:Uncharacterized protein n=1 Tax=Monoraphidium neglectum TaxID=145388 RepID=A0A0D2KB53_9CHLO|nr:hypothetical protein MNEG_14785 [Monoraphidium neglectum]KIY93178.1 hypothetical protein MNEG_14785 [Monoraphidium neglectum]|eukprot:XP_013892198.1 hypothetical protein MNEG_14785 [Monoraphidium neglectum]